MGNYEEAYRKYYSDAKAKFNIKSSKKELELKNEVIVNLDSDRDIYPKGKSDYEVDNTSPNGMYKNNCLIDGCEQNKNYKMMGTYSGIDNYNNSKMSGYESRPYYGYNGRNSFNDNIEEKTFLNKLGNRIILKLAITVGLFIAVITLKSIPYEEAKVVYTACKEVISKDFDYKEFVEDIKTINITEEMDKLKVNLKIEDEEVQVEKITEEDNANTLEAEGANKNIDETIIDKVN